MAHAHSLCGTCLSALSTEAASISRRATACLQPVSLLASTSSSLRVASVVESMRCPNHSPSPPLPYLTRPFHTSSTAQLPRSVTRLSGQVVQQEQREAEASENHLAPTSQGDDVHAAAYPSSLSVPPSSSSIPWFLQGNAIEVDPPVPSRPPHTIPTPSTTHHVPLSLPPDLPSALRLVYTHLFTGPSSGLLHRSSFNDHTEETSSSSPIAFVHVAPLQDGLSWCDWVAIVTVRENTGGGINERVARDVGDLLSRLGPPHMAGSPERGQIKAARGLEEILGPHDDFTGSKDPYGPRSTQKLIKAPHSSTQDGLDNAQSSREPTEQWFLQKKSLAAKYTHWKPSKILSRETQSGLRILHSYDPHKWSASTLSSHFKVSVEAIRRILKARPERWGGDAVERGLRRMRDNGDEPESWRREEEEIQRLRSSLGKDNASQEEQVGLEGEFAGEGQVTGEGEIAGEGQITDKGQADALWGQGAFQDQPFNGTSNLDVRSLGKPRFHIRYEGLAASSSGSVRSTARKALAAQRSDGHAAEDSGGEWVLVDAGWCIVHVMTPKAKARYDVEGVWKDVVKDQDMEGAEANG